MTDRPIIMSGGEVRAILDGRKTQTRRVIKPQPDKPFDSIFHEDAEWWTGDSLTEERIETLCVPYAIGDRLGVRETWWHDDPHSTLYTDSKPLYRADGEIDFERGQVHPTHGD